MLSQSITNQSVALPLAVVRLKRLQDSESQYSDSSAASAPNEPGGALGAQLDSFRVAAPIARAFSLLPLTSCSRITHFKRGLQPPSLVLRNIRRI